MNEAQRISCHTLRIGRIATVNKRTQQERKKKPSNGVTGLNTASREVGDDKRRID